MNPKVSHCLGSLLLPVQYCLALRNLFQSFLPSIILSLIDSFNKYLTSYLCQRAGFTVDVEIKRMLSRSSFKRKIFGKCENFMGIVKVAQWGVYSKALAWA